ncbi:hypothetical protein LIER_28522 [Lithospermum erythrorhizon]|uniref:Replication protein A OB domain-containing protein n=1 Tax=Lithospermum erythrorhizon TaxID=34254 RepID=A0AAV3RLZ4_LITER
MFRLRCEFINHELQQDIPAITCGTGRKLKRYIFMDEKGNEITILIYAMHIPVLSPKLHLFKVYDITNAQVRFVEPHVILHNDSSNLNNIDIMGVIICVQDPTTIVTANKIKKIQRFTFVDMEILPIRLTLWEESVEIQGAILIEAANSCSVVVAKRLGPSSYNGASLCSRNSSSFTVNPPIEDASNLKSWYNMTTQHIFESRTNGELQDMLVDKRIAISRELLNNGSLKILSVAELDQITRYGDY